MEASPVKTACVFAHFDPQDKVDDYVLYYLRELKRVADSIQFVTTSELCAAERRKVEELGVNFMQRKNEGYDFYSFKLGIEAIGVSRFDQLIVCNDSVYGPLSDLATVLAEMRSRNAKFWGLTNSHDYQHHLQSYFLVFAGDALQSQAFKNFWGSVQILDNKVEIIRRYEVGLSQSMAAAGFPPEALAEFRQVGNARHIGSYWRYYFKLFFRHWSDKQFWIDGFHVLSGKRLVGKNVTHLEWKSLVEDKGVPFIKIGLLRDNPKGVQNLDEVYGVIERMGNYPVTLIKNHLRRTRRSSAG
jgi:rhamnosyltransferase